jgi:hypothetical protein
VRQQHICSAENPQGANFWVLASACPQPEQSRLPRLELDKRLGGSDGISDRLVPEQHSEGLQAGELCFARLIGLLLGDPRQRPAHRAPSTAGGCNAEASRRYLLVRLTWPAFGRGRVCASCASKLNKSKRANFSRIQSNINIARV